MAKTKFFRIAVEGQTATDGRTITAEMLTQCAKNFNPETYGVRINMEHIRGYSAEPPFNAYGDVLELKTEQVTINIAGKDEQRTALFARLDPTDPLIELNRKRQKVYTSIEPQPNFAGTGEYGLVGLACTDSPASLGTEMLKFSARQDDPAAAELRAAYDARKTSKDSFFSSAHETKFELEDDATSSQKPGALEAFAALIVEKFTPKAPEPEKKPDPAPTGGAFTAAQAQEMFAGLGKAMSDEMKGFRTSVSTDIAGMKSDFAALKADVEKTPNRNHSARPDATGGDGRVQADF